MNPTGWKKKHGIELNIINPRTYGIDFYGDLLFTTEKEINEHPERVEAFKQATLKGWAYALEHQEETIDTILKKYNTRQLDGEQLRYEAQNVQQLIAREFVPLGDVHEYRFEKLLQLYNQKGIPLAKLEKALNTLIYNPHMKHESYQYLILPMGLMMTILLVLTIVMYRRNKTLQSALLNEQKTLEQSRAQTYEAMTSKSTCLVNMSHEVRTPINAVLGFVDQLQKDERDPHKQHMLKNIHAAGQTLLGIIHNTMDISKIDHGELQLDLQPCTLTHLCDEIKALLGSTCESKGIGFRVSIENSVPACAKIDEVRLKQVIVNLLSNAIKFTSKGGSVSMDLICNEPKRMLEIFIIDTGVGITPKLLNEITQLFEHDGKNNLKNFEGKGLGLTISKQLTMLMGGKLSAYSKVGEGSRFYLRLPYLECSQEAETSNETQAPITLDGKILIVEDNRTNQVLMTLILDELNLTYDIANDGHEAVMLYEQHHDDYALVLMDENLPVINGTEALKKIRSIEKSAHLSATPVIAVTANALRHDKERFIKLGMDDYLAKPYTEQSIRNMLIKFS